MADITRRGFISATLLGVGGVLGYVGKGFLDSPAQQTKASTTSSLEAIASRPHKVAIFAGHVEVTSPPDGQGPISASGIPEYQFNDGLAQTFSSIDNPSAKYDVQPATQNIPITQRPKIANGLGAEVYIELHHDSAQQDDIARLQKGDQTKERWSELSGFSVIYGPSNDYSHESLKLAQLIADELVQAGFTPNRYHARDIKGEKRPTVNLSRAIYTGREYVIRENVMPAVIVEAGVIVNPFEEAALKKEETHRKFVESIDRAVSKYFKSNSVGK